MNSPLTLAERFAAARAALPLIAILRGLKPEEAEAIAEVLYDEGFRLIELPLNSPRPCESIALIRRRLAADALIGAGTVMRIDEVGEIKQAGGELIVMPHGEPAVIRAAKEHGMIALPGAATPTEAFAALAAGADGLKLFPAEMIAPKVVKALRAVLPRTVPLFPVGGIAPESMAAYRQAGANGFGLGSALYAPGMLPEEVRQRARAFVAAWRD